MHVCEPVHAMYVVVKPRYLRILMFIKYPQWFYNSMSAYTYIGIDFHQILDRACILIIVGKIRNNIHI